MSFDTQVSMLGLNRHTQGAVMSLIRFQSNPALLIVPHRNDVSLPVLPVGFQKAERVSEARRSIPSLRSAGPAGHVLRQIPKKYVREFQTNSTKPPCCKIRSSTSLSYDAGRCPSSATKLLSSCLRSVSPPCKSRTKVHGLISSCQDM